MTKPATTIAQVIIVLVLVLLPFPLFADLTANAAGSSLGPIEGFSPSGSCSAPVYCGYYLSGVRQLYGPPDAPYVPAAFQASFYASANYGLLATYYSYNFITSFADSSHFGLFGNVAPNSSVGWNDTVTFNGSGDGFLQLNFDYETQGWYYTGQLPFPLKELADIIIGPSSLHTTNSNFSNYIQDHNPTGLFSLLFPIAFGQPLSFTVSLQEASHVSIPDSGFEEQGSASLYLESMQTFDESMDPVPLSYTSAAGATYGTPEPATGWMVAIAILAGVLVTRLRLGRNVVDRCCSCRTPLITMYGQEKIFHTTP